MADITPVTAPDGSGNMFVVADSAGFVGAFPTLAAATQATVQKYSCIPFIVYRFPWAAGPRGRVWVVLMRSSDAVAFVSNDREEAERVKGIYERVGLAYEDSIDYWEQPTGAVTPPAARRLESQQHAHDMYAGPAEAAQQFTAENEARSQAFLAAAAPDSENGPLARLLRETERITIMDCVIPGLPTAETEAVAFVPSAEPETAARAETEINAPALEALEATETETTARVEAETAALAELGAGAPAEECGDASS
jgi:hypothetical protein